MTALSTRDALAAALREHGDVAATCGHRIYGPCSECVADRLIAKGAVVDVATLADEIAGMFPYNGELRPDGSEDPQAAAYVEGLHDAWQVVQNHAAALTERAS